MKAMAKTKETDSSKNLKVEAMFDGIARRYDFLNHFLSLGTDRFWRRKAIKILGRKIKPNEILDVATGTGDFAITALGLNPQKITGIDLSENMLALGRAKIVERRLSDRIDLLRGNSESMSFSDDRFDAVICAFGVRNFGVPLTGLSEMCRVLRPGGVAMILEFSKPSAFPVKQLYFFYFRRILPLLGRIISGDSVAYDYLPDSVLAFPESDDFLRLMNEAGFQKSEYQRLSGGIATIYTGFKPD